MSDEAEQTRRARDEALQQQAADRLARVAARLRAVFEADPEFQDGDCLVLMLDGDDAAVLDGGYIDRTDLLTNVLAQASDLAAEYGDGLRLVAMRMTGEG